MNLVKSASERKQFLKFGTVGIIGSVVDFGVFNLLTIAFKLPVLSSSVVSFILAVVNNFILNRNWTFPQSKAHSLAKNLVQFSLVSLVGLLIRTPLFALMEKLLIPLAEKTVPNLLTPTIVGHNASLAVAIGVVLLWNYFANRFWTFKNISV